MNKNFYAILTTLIFALILVFTCCYAEAPHLPMKDIRLLWRPMYALPLHGSHILIKVGDTDEATGYIMYEYEEFMNDMIENAGGYYLLKPMGR